MLTQKKKNSPKGKSEAPSTPSSAISVKNNHTKLNPTWCRLATQNPVERSQDQEIAAASTTPEHQSQQMHRWVSLYSRQLGMHDSVHVHLNEAAKRQAAAHHRVRGMQIGEQVFFNPDACDLNTIDGRKLLTYEMIREAERSRIAEDQSGNLAITRDGKTTFLRTVILHSKQAEIEAHEAVHQAQFAIRSTGAPIGSRAQLEAEAHEGAQRIQKGFTFVPSYASAPGMTLAYNEEQIVQMLESMPQHIASIVGLLGGLQSIETDYPDAWQRIRRLLSEATSAEAYEILYRRDSEILEMVASSERIVALLDELILGFERANQQEALEIALNARQHLDFSYVSIIRGVQEQGEIYIDFWHHSLTAATPEAVVRDLHQEALAQQMEADRQREVNSCAIAAAQQFTGRQVATLEGILYDTNVNLSRLLEPEEGCFSELEALTYAHISGEACAVVQVNERWHIFALDEQLDYDDVWLTEQWEEHRTKLVPAGIHSRFLTTIDGYVLRARNSRYFGGDQNRRPAEYLEVNERLLEEHGDELSSNQAVNLFKQLVRNNILLRLDDSRRALVAAKHRFRPTLGTRPDANEARRLRQDASALRRHVLAAGQMTANADVLTNVERRQLQETISAIGRIVTDNPAAAMMIVDNRDQDDRDQAPEEDDIVDRTTGVEHDEHASWRAIQEINERLANIEHVQRHLHANPDSVLDLEPIHERYINRFDSFQRLQIRVAKFGHQLSTFASAIGMTALELGLLITGLFSGGMTALLAGAASAALGMRSTQQMFERVETLEAMSALDMAGELALASPEDASSARMWAWIGVGLSFLEVGGLVRSTRRLGRLQSILESSELSRVLAHSEQRISGVAQQLGMSEPELVRRLHSLRGAFREELIGRIRQATESSYSGGRASYGNIFDWEDAGYHISELEMVRTQLLARRDIGRVVESLRNFGIPANREMVQTIKKYNFDSAGLGFFYDNFAAWNRLARGEGTVQDAQYLMHEIREVRELQRIQAHTGFDFMGRDLARMTRRARRNWRADFDRYYIEAHTRALEAEYDFVVQQVRRFTGNRVNISRSVAAAVDPFREEARLYMLVDDIPLIDHQNFRAVGDLAMFAS